MSKEGMEEFIDAVRKDASLSSELVTLITFLAQEKGHDVDEEDVREFLNDIPSARPLPGHGGDDPAPITTEAVGEDKWDHDRPSVTLAIGEESGATRAVGEGRPPRRPSTEAVGEEGGRMTTMAMGEEGTRFRGPRK